ncbi:MAG: hypothetical protein ABJF11_08230 [Reichenbachiella sp.]|uniref:hypothetical protein n=1 Tax=Reichenbachiella sp. TaxID=2184521 RepID=UPI003263EFE3
MNTMKITSYILTIFILWSCDYNPKSQAMDKDQIKLEVQQMFDNYHKDIATDGLLAEFKYLDTSADFYWVPPGYDAALSYDSVETILTANAKSFQQIYFGWDTLQIFPLTADIANYSGIVLGEMTDTAGTQMNVSIIESGTVIRREDGWKLLSGQSATLSQ